MRRRHLPQGARVGTFAGLSARTLRARPLRSALTAAAIVLGVGMVFGVLLLVGTIHSTFGKLYDSVYGRTDIVVSGKQSAGSLPETTIDHVRLVRGVKSASGNIFSLFRTVDAKGKVSRSRSDTIYVVGVDYAQPDSTDSRQTAGRNPVPGGGEFEVDRGWAAKHHVGVGDRVSLSTPTGLIQLRISGLFEFGGGMDLGGYGMASLPVQDARAIMDKRGVWDEINIVVDKGTPVGAVQARLERRLGGGVEVTTPKVKNNELQDQLSSMDTVLYFFSGIALFVGAFLILNSFNMTVLQRMREIGTLRALGASDRRVAASILGEALVLGAVGSVVGLGLGAGLAVVLVKAMQGFGMPVSTVDYAVWPAVAAVITGLIATLAGAARPAIRGARIAPVQAMTGQMGTSRWQPSRRRLIAGTVMFVPGMAVGGLFWFGNTSNSNGFLTAVGGVGMTMVMLYGMVLLAPFIVLPLVRLMGRPLRRAMPAEGRLAVAATQSNPGRTSATAATLLVALSVVVVNATVAASFVGSVKDELNKRFARDLTVQPLDYQDYGPPQSALSARLREQIARMPETGAVAGRRVLYLTELPGSKSQGMVVAYDPYAYDRVDRPTYLGAPRAAILRGLASGGVVISKLYATTQGLHIGDMLTLRGPSSVRRLPIVGKVDSYDAGGHMLQVSTRTMESVYGVRNDVQLAIKAKSPAERGALLRRVNALIASDYPGVEALSNATVKQRITNSINQQFGFFNAIVAIAVLVGMLGIVNTLSMSVLERTREIGVLRAIGASRWRVRRTMADESLLISLAGTFAGIIAGMVVALVWVVGMRSKTFPGLELKLPAGTLIGIAILGVVIGVLAAILPARRAARLDPLTALRYE